MCAKGKVLQNIGETVCSVLKFTTPPLDESAKGAAAGPSLVEEDLD